MTSATHPATAPDVRRDRSGFPAGGWLLLVLIALAIAYWPTLASIEAIWRRSSTFAHGYLVLPIAAGLVWLHRRELAAIEPAPCWPALAVIVAAGIGWMAGDLAGVMALEQFSLYAMIVGVLVTVLGTAFAREIAFPLGFLVFAVPFGEFLVPVLIDRTADFTLVALQASGVPVFREGNVLTIPSGRWSVVDACSGIRYLMASVMVGALFAYLNYRSLRKRLWFLLASILVPIVANWLRAYLIVMLGHLTNNRLATGVDHFIYGWVFFGLVIVLMFWVGSRWRDPDALANRAPAPPAARASSGGASVALAALLALAAAVAWRPLTGLVESRAPPASRPLAAIPAEGSWRSVPVPDSRWTPHYTGARSVLEQWFVRDAEPVGLYVALYSGQSQGRELIEYRNQLVLPDDKTWKKIAESRRPVRWAGEALDASAVELASGPVQLSARAWYWVDGRFTTSDSLAKGLLALARVFGRPDHSAVIVIYTPITDSAGSEAERLDRFSDEIGPAVMQALRDATR